jgi:hypothetical protein
MITKIIIFCSQTGLITTQVLWYWQWICAHCFLFSVVALIAIGIVSASSHASTMVLTKMQWAAFRFDIYHLHMCFPIGGCESLVFINSSIRNDLTIDSIRHMSSRQVSRSQRRQERLLISCSALSLGIHTYSHRQSVVMKRFPTSALHVSRRWFMWARQTITPSIRKHW